MKWGDLLPNVLLMKHTGQIASPVAAGPSSTLLQEDLVVLERGLDFGLGMVLHPGLPAMRHHPASDEVVVVGIQLVLAKPPLFVGEPMGENLVLHDMGPVRYRSARHAREPSIDMGGCRTVKVSPLEVQRSEEAPDALGEGRGDVPTQTLTGDDAAIALVLLERR